MSLTVYGDISKPDSKIDVVRGNNTPDWIQIERNRTSFNNWMMWSKTLDKPGLNIFEVAIKTPFKSFFRSLDVMVETTRIQ